MTENKNTSTPQSGVPVWRFYTMVVLMAALGFLGGKQYGKSVAEVDNATSVIEMQGEANEIFKERYGNFPRTRDGLLDYLLLD